MTIKDITSFLETVAPPDYQEDYDNSGLIIGDPLKGVKRVLITLDATEQVVDEAIKEKCELIIAHHPIIFRGLKRLNGRNYVERTVIRAIKNDIAIYAIHTNLDNIYTGVNRKIAEKLDLQNIEILSPKKQTLSKLVFFCPQENTMDILQAVHAMGAGTIGDYSHCSFKVNGEGSFMPLEGSDPHVGQKNALENVKEDRIEVQLENHREKAVLDALFDSHPYEEVAYYLQRVENTNQRVGSGMVGELKNPMDPADFLKYVKTRMGLECIRHTALLDGKIRKVAFCGGAGSFLLGSAKSAAADVFITADFKYHEFFDAENELMIMDIGHYESEVFTKDLLLEFLSEKFTNIAPILSKVDTNPVRYFN